MRVCYHAPSRRRTRSTKRRTRQVIPTVIDILSFPLLLLAMHTTRVRHVIDGWFPTIPGLLGRRVNTAENRVTVVRSGYSTTRELDGVKRCRDPQQRPFRVPPPVSCALCNLPFHPIRQTPASAPTEHLRCQAMKNKSQKTLSWHVIDPSIQMLRWLRSSANEGCNVPSSFPVSQSQLEIGSRLCKSMVSGIDACP